MTTSESMISPSDYAYFVKRQAATTDAPTVKQLRLLRAVLGLTSELAEYDELVLSDRDQLGEFLSELGDVYFWLVELASTMGMSLSSSLYETLGAETTFEGHELALITHSEKFTRSEFIRSNAKRAEDKMAIKIAISSIYTFVMAEAEFLKITENELRDYNYAKLTERHG